MQVKHLLLIAILAMTAACSSTKEVVDENLSEVELYQQAQKDLDNSGSREGRGGKRESHGGKRERQG